MIRCQLIIIFVRVTGLSPWSDGVMIAGQNATLLAVDQSIQYTIIKCNSVGSPSRYSVYSFGVITIISRPEDLN